MEKLFSYGTLQLENVQLETFGRKLVGYRDELVGYVLTDIIIKDPSVIETSGTNVHPILKFTGKEKDIVEGTVFEITAQELENADEYEVDEYTRVLGHFKSGLRAWAYVCAKTESEKDKSCVN